MIRAFIAIELTNKLTIDNIKLFSARLKQNQPKLKVVAPENLHITIKFLGNTSESLTPKIYKILKEEINERILKGRKYEYKLKGVGQFNKFSVLWVKLVGDIQFLQEIKNSTEQLLAEKLNIQKDKRMQFKPHLTIGRLKRDKINYQNFSALKNLINENRDLEFGPFIIDQVKLKKSVLTSKGPIYSDLVY
jgi:2'-5' RNA ligase